MRILFVVLLLAGVAQGLRAAHAEERVLALSWATVRPPLVAD